MKQKKSALEETQWMKQVDDHMAALLPSLENMARVAVWYCCR